MNGLPIFQEKGTYESLLHEDPRVRTIWNRSKVADLTAGAMSEAIISQTSARIFADVDTVVKDLAEGAVFRELGCCVFHEQLSEDILVRVIKANSMLYEFIHQVNHYTEVNDGVEKTFIIFRAISDDPRHALQNYQQIQKQTQDALNVRSMQGMMKVQVALSFHIAIVTAHASTSMVTLTAWTPAQNIKSVEIPKLPQNSQRIEAGAHDGELQLLRGTFDVMSILFEKYKHRGFEVDEADDEQFCIDMDRVDPTQAESALVSKSVGLVESQGWKPLSSAISLVRMHKRIESDGRDIWGKCTTHIDTSAERIAARLINFNSNANFELYLKTEGVTSPRYAIEVPDSHSLLFHRVLKAPSPVRTRYFEVWQVWSRLTYRGRRAIAVVGCPLDDFDRSDRLKERIRLRDTTGLIKGRVWAVQVISEVAPKVCELICLNRVDLAGNIPTRIVEWKLPQQFSWVRALQEEKRRNDNDVDGEVQAVMARELLSLRAPHRNLSDDQRSVVDLCAKLKADSFEDSWRALDAMDPFTTSWIHYERQKKGERTVATARSTVTIDASPQIVASRYWDFMSREAIRDNIETGSKARTIVSQGAQNDMITAQIKKMPFFFSDREFVTRHIMSSNPLLSNSFTISIASLDLHVDYGEPLKATRAQLTVRVDLDPLPGDPHMCKLTLHQRVDAGGFIPAWLVNLKVQDALAWVHDYRKHFSRDEEIDKIQQRTLARTIRKSQENDTMTDREATTFMKYVRAFKVMQQRKQWKKVDVKDHLFTVESAADDQDENTHTFIYRVQMVVDTDALDCMTWELSKMSRAQLKIHYESGGIHRECNEISPYTLDFAVTTPVDVVGFAPRELHNEIISGFYDRKYASVYAPAPKVRDNVDSDTKTVRGTSSGASHFATMFSQKVVRLEKNISCWNYEEIPQVGCVKRTLVTLIQQVSISDFEFIREKFTHDTLTYMSRMRRAHDKSKQVDAVAFDESIKIFKRHHNEVYTKEEETMVNECLTYFASFEDTNNKTLKKLRTRNPTVTLETTIIRGDNVAWAKSETRVRATKEELLSYLWNTEARCRWSKSDEERRVIERRNAHHQIQYKRKRRFHAGALTARSREALHATIWKRLRGGGFINAGVTHISDTYIPRGHDCVRVNMPEASRLTDMSNGYCKFEFIHRLDIGGNIPKRVAESISKYSERSSLRVQRYFQQLRTLEQYDNEDGKALATTLLYDERSRVMIGRRSNRSEAVKFVFDSHVGLEDLAAKYPWLVGLLEEAIKGDLNMSMSIKTKLECLSEKEARQIGKNLIPALKARKNPAAGLAQWIRDHQSMAELIEIYPWFEVLMLEIAKGIVRSAPWGLMWRVSIGAFLSTMDLVTDIIMVVTFLRRDDEATFGIALISMVCMCVFFQLVVVHVQHMRKMTSMAVIEGILTLLGLKPVIDAARVGRGDTMQAHHFLDPITELSATKCTELFCESIPGTVLQFYAILDTMLKGRTLEMKSISSIVVSILSTGFTATVMSYDLDTDPKKRKHTPDFYGYISDSARLRTFMFLLLLFSSSCLMAARSLSTALLLTLEPRWAFIYIGSDYALFIVVKLLRNDFIHFFPFEGVIGVIMSFMVRVFVKGISDFTGIVHFRHPQDLGGAYWTLNAFLGIAATLGTVLLFGEMEEGLIVEESTLKVDGLWQIASGMASFWIVCFTILLLVMKPKFRKTFWSTQTSKQATCAFFLDGKVDEIRMVTLSHNRLHWQPYIGDQVKEWVMKNWERWSLEQPDWLTDNVRSTIPLEFIPNKAAKKQEEETRKSQRGTVLQLGLSRTSQKEDQIIPVVAAS